MKKLIGIRNGKGEIGRIDHLGNRRIRSVGEMAENQFRVGSGRSWRTIPVKRQSSLGDLDAIMPPDLINAKPISAAVKNSLALHSFHSLWTKTTHCLKLLSNVVSALGQSGLTRERAGFEVRDVHRNSLLVVYMSDQTPEGPNIGLINSLSAFARCWRLRFP